jgi:cysteine-rich repeat protein
MTTTDTATSGSGQSGAETDVGSTTASEPVCGDGKLDPGEACDNGSGNGDAGLCTATCTAAICGDGLVSPIEQCDDGNDIDDDGCNNACSQYACGDGMLGPGEACDNGAGNSDSGLCTSACKFAVCGDGLVSPLEQCDDGNADDADLCGNTCILKTCGDGDLDDGEECDDGNVIDNDGCTTSCKSAACGDGIIQAGEVCDDGNNDNDDACTTACTPPACGDGFVQADEQCDGPTPGVDLCTVDCVALRVDDFIFNDSGGIPEFKDAIDPNKPPVEGTTSSSHSVCRSFSAPADNKYPYVHDIEFTLSIVHPRVGELVLYLRSPMGSWLIVSNRPGFAEPAAGSNIAGGNVANFVAGGPVFFADTGKYAGETIGVDLPTDKAACLDDARCSFAPDRGASTKSLASFASFAGMLAAGGSWWICVQDQVPNLSKGTLKEASLTMYRRKQP